MLMFEDPALNDHWWRQWERQKRCGGLDDYINVAHTGEKRSLEEYLLG